LVSTTDTNDELSTNNNVTLDGSGNATVFATALEFGPIELLPATVTVIDTPITGWDTVTNPDSATPGTNQETDSDLRARRQRSVARDAQAIYRRYTGSNREYRQCYSSGSVGKRC